MIRKLATLVTWIFSPLLIPSYAALILLYTSFHYTLFSWPAKRFLLIVVFASTALMPALTVIISEFGKKFGLSDRKTYDNRVSMLFVALYYYLGFYLLNKMPMYAIFKILLLAGSILVVLLMIISLWKEISNETAALGAVFGMLVALSLRIGINPVLLLSGVALSAGISGTAVMLRRDMGIWAILSGFAFGVTVFFLIFYLL